MPEDHTAVDRLLAQVRDAAAGPSDDFLARMVALAEAAQPPAPALSGAAPTRATAPGTAPRRSLFALLGGWPALGGLSAATLAGFWIGVTPPQSLSIWAAEAAGQVVDIGFYGEDDVLALLEG